MFTRQFSHSSRSSFPLIFLLSRFLLGVQLGSNMKYLYFGIPAVIFAVTCTMPANLTIYWFINNNITVLFFTICRQEKVKNYFQILDPPDLEHGKESKNDFMSFQKGKSLEIIINRDLVDSTFIAGRLTR